MTTQANIETQVSEPDADQVCRYLRNHPEFFEQQPDLLAELKLPHSTGAAISLIERQVNLFREQNEDLKSRLLELIDVARENDRLNERMHTLTTDLIAAQSLVELLGGLEDHLRNKFNADTVAIHLAAIDDTVQRETAACELNVDETVRNLFQSAFSDSRPQCGRLKLEQLEFLFGEQAVAIESTALLPLGDHAKYGLLAIGSREGNRFHPGMGTLFLNNLGDLVTVLLENHGFS